MYIRKSETNKNLKKQKPNKNLRFTKNVPDFLKKMKIL